MARFQTEKGFICHLNETDTCAFGKTMTQGQCQDNVFCQQGDARDAWFVQRRSGDAEVEGSVFELLHQGRHTVLEETKADVRVVLVKGAQEVREDVGGGTERELDLSLVSSCQIGQFPLPLLQFRKDPFHVLQEGFAKEIEADTPPRRSNKETPSSSSNRAMV